MGGALPVRCSRQAGHLKEVYQSLFLAFVMIRMPSTMIVGPSGSGKTQLTEALLMEGSVFEGRKTQACHYCHAIWQLRFDGMKRQSIQFHEGIPEVADLQTWFPQGGVLLLDDLMDERGNDKCVSDLFT